MLVAMEPVFVALAMQMLMVAELVLLDSLEQELDHMVLLRCLRKMEPEYAGQMILIEDYSQVNSALKH